MYLVRIQHRPKAVQWIHGFVCVVVLPAKEIHESCYGVVMLPAKEMHQSCHTHKRVMSQMLVRARFAKLCCLCIVVLQCCRGSCRQLQACKYYFVFDCVVVLPARNNEQHL